MKLINFKQLFNKTSNLSLNDIKFNNVKSNKSLVPKIKSSRNVFNGNGSNYLNKFNLKQFGGKNDKDFDGVLNKFDCQPGNVMRQHANKILKAKVDNYSIAYSRSNTHGPVKNTGFIKHKNLGRKRGIMDNTIKKYPNLIKDLDEYDGTIMINDSSPNYTGLYNSQENNITLPFTWQEIPARERAEILFHELQHAKDAKRINKGKVNFYSKGQSLFEEKYDEEFSKVGYIQNKFERAARREGAQKISVVDYPHITTHSRESFISERMVKKLDESEKEHDFSEVRYKQANDNIIQHNIKSSMINMTTPTYQARTQRGMEDDDGDGVNNLNDCEPDDKTRQDMRFERRPNKMPVDEWESQKKMMEKATNKSNSDIFPKLKMNTIIANDKELKKLNNTHSVWRDDDWKRKYNKESIIALKMQGYNDDDALGFIADKNKTKHESSAFFAQELAKNDKIGHLFKGAIPTIPITKEEGKKRYEKNIEDNKHLKLINMSVKDLNKKPYGDLKPHEEIYLDDKAVYGKSKAEADAHWKKRDEQIKEEESNIGFGISETDFYTESGIPIISKTDGTFSEFKSPFDKLVNDKPQNNKKIFSDMFALDEDEFDDDEKNAEEYYKKAKQKSVFEISSTEREFIKFYEEQIIDEDDKIRNNKQIDLNNSNRWQVEEDIYKKENDGIELSTEEKDYVEYNEMLDDDFSKLTPKEKEFMVEYRHKRGFHEDLFEGENDEVDTEKEFFKWKDNKKGPGDK